MCPILHPTPLSPLRSDSPQMATILLYHTGCCLLYCNLSRLCAVSSSLAVTLHSEIRLPNYCWVRFQHKVLGSHLETRISFFFSLRCSLKLDVCMGCFICCSSNIVMSEIVLVIWLDIRLQQANVSDKFHTNTFLTHHIYRRLLLPTYISTVAMVTVN